MEWCISLKTGDDRTCAWCPLTLLMMIDWRETPLSHRCIDIILCPLLLPLWSCLEEDGKRRVTKLFYRMRRCCFSRNLIITWVHLKIASFSFNRRAVLLFFHHCLQDITGNVITKGQKIISIQRWDKDVSLRWIVVFIVVWGCVSGTGKYIYS